MTRGVARDASCGGGRYVSWVGRKAVEKLKMAPGAGGWRRDPPVDARSGDACDSAVGGWMVGWLAGQGAGTGGAGGVWEVRPHASSVLPLPPLLLWLLLLLLLVVVVVVVTKSPAASASGSGG